MPFKTVADQTFEYNGNTIKKGEAFPVTVQQIQEGIMQQLPLTYAGTFISNYKDMIALAKKGTEGRINAKDFTAQQKSYEETLDSYKSSLGFKAVLRDSARLAAEGNVLGLRGYFGDVLDKSLNAIGVPKGKAAAFLEKYRTTDKAKYDSQQKRLGVAMATELLREGSKTLSDFDRKRVEELIGDLVGANGIIVSEEVLRSKLANLEKTLDSNITKTGASLRATEKRWLRESTKGGTALGSILPDLRREVLGSTTITSRSKQPGIIKITDIYDLGSKKFKPGYKNIFGSS